MTAEVRRKRMDELEVSTLQCDVARWLHSGFELAKVLLDCSAGTSAGKALSHRIGRAAPGAQCQRLHSSTQARISLYNMYIYR